MKVPVQVTLLLFVASVTCGRTSNESSDDVDMGNASVVTVFDNASSAVTAECGEVGVLNDPNNGLPCGVSCKDGLIIPIWKASGPDQYDYSTGDRIYRGGIYIVIMIYLFIGVAIVCDKFMESIEMITAQEKEVRVKDPKTGTNKVMVVKVWNETVANLTLMALGSSAPEIMLAVVEMFFEEFKAGELGPGTIVGSAAFNLFMIIGLCQYVIPDDEVRKIKHLRVFFITASCSILAYVWLYLIVAVITPHVVDIWEGVVTFSFFPITVYMAFVADRRLFFYKYMDKKYVAGTRGVIIQSEKEGVKHRVESESEGASKLSDGEKNNILEQLMMEEPSKIQNSVQKLFIKNKLKLHANGWRDQFIKAVSVQGDDDDDDENDNNDNNDDGCGNHEENENTCSARAYIVHFLVLPWKLVFAFIPPTSIMDGYPTFIVSIMAIGLCTAVIGDVAKHLGCFINLKDSVNAIAFVALGTSVPDTFASKTAAINDETADASVGNVTGSNAVNVFLGIGIAWSMAAIVHWAKGTGPFVVHPGNLGFSVTLFIIEAFLAILILLLRRHPKVGGELGGPKLIKTITSSLFVFFWVFYVLVSGLEAYGVIKPGF